MITHHVEEIPEGFTHAMLLDEGEVVAQGLLDDVLTSENLTKAFHQPIQVDRLGSRFCSAYESGPWFAPRRIGRLRFSCQIFRRIRNFTVSIIAIK